MAKSDIMFNSVRDIKGTVILISVKMVPVNRYLCPSCCKEMNKEESAFMFYFACPCGKEYEVESKS